MNEKINLLVKRDFAGDQWPEFCEGVMRLGIAKGLLPVDIINYLVNNKMKLIVKKKKSSHFISLRR